MRPGCAMSALSARTSSPTRSSRCCTRRRSPAATPGSACSTRPWRTCAFPLDGQELTQQRSAEPADRRQRQGRARRRPRAWARCWASNMREFALITNTLAKDKEIEDRWRKFPRPVSSRNLANFVEDEVVDALATAVTAAYPDALAPLLQAEGEVVRRRPARLLGPQRAAAGGCRPHASPGPMRPGSCSTPTPPSRPSWRASAGSSSTSPGSTRRRGRARRPAPSPTRPCRQRASLSAAQLSRQDARRDDAGARARPRRASGAGGAAGRADVGHAADPGRDRLGVRRDADLPGAAEAGEAMPSAAASCWPARSRTC